MPVRGRAMVVKGRNVCEYVLVEVFASHEDFFFFFFFCGAVVTNVHHHCHIWPAVSCQVVIWHAVYGMHMFALGSVRMVYISMFNCGVPCRIYKGSVRLVVTNVHYHHHHHYIRNPSLSLQSSQAYYDCNRHHWHQPPLAPNHRRLGNSVWQVTL